MTRYLEHVPSGDLYVWTEYLAARADMRPHPGPESKPHQGSPSDPLWWEEILDEWPDGTTINLDNPYLDSGTLTHLVKAKLGVDLGPAGSHSELVAQTRELIANAQEPEQYPEVGSDVVIQQEPPEPTPDPEAMTRHELMDYAQAALGVTLSPRDKKEDLLAQVQTLIQDRDGNL